VLYKKKNIYMKIEEYIIIDVLFLRVFELQRAREGVLYIYIYIYIVAS